MGRVTADIDLHRLMRELTLSANRANATIYTIDPRGLAGVVDAGQYVDQSEWRTYHAEDHEHACVTWPRRPAAFAVVNTNDFAGELKRDRRRNQRLLRARLLLDQSRSDQADPDAGGQGRSAGRDGRVAARHIR